MASRFSIICIAFALLTTNLFSSVLEWDRTEVTINLAPDEEEARAVYTVTNKGDSTIRIDRIKSSCGCTGSVVDRKIIEPLQSTEVVGIFSKGKRQGLNRNRLEVFVDNQTEPVATLKMNVQIPTLVEVSPQIVYWNAQGSKNEREIRIALDDRYIDSIDKIEYDESKLTVTKERNPNAAGNVDYIIKVTPKSYDQPYRGSLTLHCSGSKDRKIEKRVHVFVQP